MGEFQAFAGGGEHDGVLADHVAAAQGCEANVAGATGAGLALTAPLRHLAQIDLTPARGSLAEADGGAGAAGGADGGGLAASEEKRSPSP